MRNIRGIELNRESREELLPGYDAAFPYIATCAELDQYIEPVVPWHWHRPVELFYMESGCLEYSTPNGKWVFPAGSGGFVNSNVLHTSRIKSSDDSTIQLLHLFDPVFLSGEHGNRMEVKYIRPLSSAPAVEIIALHPNDPGQADLLKAIRQAFEVSDSDWGYEFELRRRLTDIWLKLFDLARPSMESTEKPCGTDDKVKVMMTYIYEHFHEPISVEQLAESAHVSKRVCFRLFQENLHMTPVEYMRSFRLHKACQMLTGCKEPITQIAYSCGLGSSSYFGKVFREHFGCSPAEYRKKWHDCDMIGHQ